MRTILLSAVIACACVFASPSLAHAERNVTVNFEASESYSFSADERAAIETIAQQAMHDVAALMPDLPENITVTVSTVDRDLSMVGGVIGMALRPGEVVATISTSYPGGVGAAADAALRSVLFHEFHHLARGWTIEENQFGRGIDIAAVNEGLADVFRVEYTAVEHEMLAPPEDIEDWTAEVLALPRDADYGEWMNQHPDGRAAIGYRVGAHIVRKAMHRSGLDVLALSEMSPPDIIAMAGY